MARAATPAPASETVSISTRNAARQRQISLAKRPRVFSFREMPNPRRAAVLRVAFHAQPFARAHCVTSRCPPFAASEHVYLSHGQPFARAHCVTSRRPLTFRSSRFFFHRQLVRQGHRSSHHGHRSHEVPQDPAPPLQERLP